MTADAADGEVLSGSRVLLRPFRQDDVPAVLRYASDPEVTRHLPWDAYDDAATAEAFITSTRRGGDRWYARAIELRDSGEVVGGVDLRIVAPAERMGEIGYALARVFWGRGYAREAAELMIDFGFRDVRLEAIQALSAGDNRRSIRTLESLGMVPEPLPVFPTWGIVLRPDHQRWVLTRASWAGPGGGGPDGASGRR
jgi:ribosomal-protein-alanine N-acetyltransferase